MDILLAIRGKEVKEYERRYTEATLDGDQFAWRVLKLPPYLFIGDNVYFVIKNEIHHVTKLLDYKKNDDGTMQLILSTPVEFGRKEEVKPFKNYKYR